MTMGCHGRAFAIPATLRFRKVGDFAYYLFNRFATRWVSRPCWGVLIL